MAIFHIIEQNLKNKSIGTKIHSYSTEFSFLNVNLTDLFIVSNAFNISEERLKEIDEDYYITQAFDLIKVKFLLEF